jgi:hypothetical protein
MAIEQKVIIRVEIDPDMSKAAAVNAFLKTFDKDVKKSNKSLSNLSNGFSRGLAAAAGTAAKGLANFGKTMLKLNFKGLIVELGLVTLGLLSMKVALAGGRMAMKAWESTVSFARVSVAGFAAGVLTLVSALAAANREFTQTQLAPWVGGIQEARNAMRSTMGMAGTSVLGMQNLSQTVSTLARAGTSVGRMGPIIREMGNISGGDPKQMQAFAQAVAQVRQTGDVSAGAEALKGMGPAFSEQASKAGTMGADEFMNALASGELTPDAFVGQLDALNNTLMGRFKGMVTRFYSQFADMGSVFLEPLKNALSDVEHILHRTIFRVRGAITDFGMESFIPGIVNQFERLTNWLTTIVVRDLPRLMGVMGKIADWWRGFKGGTVGFFTDLSSSLRSFTDAGDTAWIMVKNLFGEIGDFASGRFSLWKQSIEDNANAFKAFGTELGRFLAAAFTAMTRYKDEFFIILPRLNEFMRFLSLEVFPVISDFSTQFVKAFKSALPVITAVVSAFLPLLKVLNTLIGVIAELPGGLGGLAVLAGGYFSMTNKGRGSLGGFLSQMKSGGPVEAGASNQFAREAGYRLSRSRFGQAIKPNMDGGARNMLAGIPLFGGRSAIGPPASGGGGMNGFMGRFFPGIQQRADHAAKPAWEQGMEEWYGRKPPAKFGEGGPRGMAARMKERMTSGRQMGLGTTSALAMGSMAAGQMIGGDFGGGMSNAGMFGSMGAMAGGEKWGAKAGLAGMGLGFGKAAWESKSAAGGAMSGAAAGASLGAMTGLPGGKIVGALAGAILGGIKGRANANKLKEAGERFADTFTREVITGIDKNAVGADAIKQQLKDLDELLSDKDRLKAMGAEHKMSADAFRDRMLENRVRVLNAEAGALNRLSEASTELSDMVDMSSSDIKDAAKDWGIALQGGKEAITAFVHKLNEDFKSMTKAMWQDVINTAVFDSWRDNPFAEQVAQDEAQGQGVAANQALWEYLQSGGTLGADDIMGNQLMAAGIDAALNQGQAKGLSGLALEDFLSKAMMSMGVGAKQQGFNIADGTFDPLYAASESRIGQTKQNFEESAAFANLEQMSTLIGEGPETDGFKERIARIWAGGNAAAELQQMNNILHSDAAESLGALTGEAWTTAAAIKKLRDSLYAGELPLDEAVDMERASATDATNSYGSPAQGRTGGLMPVVNPTRGSPSDKLKGGRGADWVRQ